MGMNKMLNKEYDNITKVVKPYCISLYLEKSGWNFINLKNRRPFDVYQRKLGGVLQQINVPFNDQLADFDNMLFNACLRLSEYEGISLDDLVLKLTNPQADVIKIRTNSTSVSNGSIPFDEAVNLLENSKKLIIDAALDITSKTKYRTSGRYSKDVDSFISKCRFGQTEIGSYVISIICPFDNINSENKEQLRLFNDTNSEDNFSRKVVRKVFKSINCISQYIEKEEDLSLLLNNDGDEFVSLNFMEDLNSLIQPEKDSFIELKAELDSITSDKNEGDINALFHSNKKTELTKFVDLNKNNDDDDQLITIFGYISKTTAEPILQQRVEGEITVKEESSNCNYKIVLEKEYYDNALAAHKNGQLVKVVGKKMGDKIINPCFEIIGK